LLALTVSVGLVRSAWLPTLSLFLTDRLRRRRYCRRDDDSPPERARGDPADERFPAAIGASPPPAGPLAMFSISSKCRDDRDAADATRRLAAGAASAPPTQPRHYLSMWGACRRNILPRPSTCGSRCSSGGGPICQPPRPGQSSRGSGMARPIPPSPRGRAPFPDRGHKPSQRWRPSPNA